MINREGDVRDANAFMSADRHRLMTSVGRGGRDGVGEGRKKENYGRPRLLRAVHPNQLLRPRRFPPA